MFSYEQIQRSIKDQQLNRRWFMAYAGALSSIPLLSRTSWRIRIPASLAILFR